MKIDVEMLAGQQLKASFGKYQVISDQSISAGGAEEYPEPFDYFMVSTVLCAGFYVRKFCHARDISTEGIKLSQESEKLNDGDKRRFVIYIDLPESFPKKYRKAVVAAVNSCTVKKVIQEQPDFEVIVK